MKKFSVLEEMVQVEPLIVYENGSVETVCK